MAAVIAKAVLIEVAVASEAIALEVDEEAEAVMASVVEAVMASEVVVEEDGAGNLLKMISDIYYYLRIWIKISNVF